MRKRKDTLRKVYVVANGKTWKEPRVLRLLGGRLSVGQRVTLARDELPFRPIQFICVGIGVDGTPKVEFVDFVKGTVL